MKEIKDLIKIKDDPELDVVEISIDGSDEVEHALDRDFVGHPEDAVWSRDLKDYFDAGVEAGIKAAATHFARKMKEIYWVEY